MSSTLWKNFQVELTADSSPTLRLIGVHPLDQTKSAESMHHSGGAATETLYIYGEAITCALIQFSSPTLRICSVGLGLGYNEILVALLNLQNPSKSSTLDSFEIDPELVLSFRHWVFELNSHDENQMAKNRIYDQIVQCLAEKLKINIESLNIKKFIQSKISSGSWRFLPELNFEKIPENPRYHLCLFDAFSQKTTQELWSNQFLEGFIGTCFDQSETLLATYACTGVLTRSLKAQGFSVIKRPGFQGKRDSTWAERRR